jgi:hypothetical protein
MSALQDREMERLSELLARGTLNNAREIARLLRGELGQQGLLGQDHQSVVSGILRLV